MERVFEFVKNYKLDHEGASPSYDENAEALGMSKSTVKYHLYKLEQEKRLKVNGTRNISIPNEEYTIGD